VCTALLSGIPEYPKEGNESKHSTPITETPQHHHPPPRASHPRLRRMPQINPIQPPRVHVPHQQCVPRPGAIGVHAAVEQAEEGGCSEVCCGCVRSGNVDYTASRRVLLRVSTWQDKPSQVHQARSTVPSPRPDKEFQFRSLLQRVCDIASPVHPRP